MNKITEALKMAEEALHAELESETYEKFQDAAEKCHEALAAIREALAEPVKQEPVAWMFKVKRTTKAITVLDEFAAIDYLPQDGEEIISKKPLSYAAPVQPVQEPVAWLIPGSITGDKKLAEANGDYATPLYAAALPVPEVQWRDLTDDDWNDIDCYAPQFLDSTDIEAVGRLAIAKFKEKNTPVQREQETLAYKEAKHLAEWLFRKHYASNEDYASGRIVWGVCDTTVGIITQIDNMVCKLEIPLAQREQQEPVAWMVTSEGLDGTPKTYPLTGRYKDVLDACDFGDPVPLYAAPAQPMNQEPVAWMDLHKELGQLRWMGGDEGWDNAIHAVRKRIEELYAAPVDAKAIRAEALEEAEEIAKTIGGSFAEEFLAAIRAIKDKS